MPPGNGHRRDYKSTQSIFIHFGLCQEKTHPPLRLTLTLTHHTLKKKKIYTPISNLAIYLAHNHRKRAELLTSLVAYPGPESTLKRMYSTGFPSLPAHYRRQIQ